MARLTEEMIIARTRQSDLSSIKKLNCWGSDLVDVSLLRRMATVEVLALSLNKISHLNDFEECWGLQELYLRKNNIAELSELCYLQNLPKLRNLWLDENPCASEQNYRLTVLRTLPKLKTLDNIPVTAEEVHDASIRGRDIFDDKPYIEDESEYIVEEEDQNIRQGNSPNEAEYSDYDKVEYDKYVPQMSKQNSQQRYSPEQSPVRDQSPQRHSPQSPRQQTRTYNNYDQGSPGSEGSGGSPRTSPRERMFMATSESTQSMKEYGNNDSYHQPRSNHNAFRHSNNDLTESNQWNDNRPDPRGDCRYGSEVSGYSREGSVANAVMGNLRGFHRRPVARNSNLLSAVLCLVKELDYPSLEVVELAVRCRMDEMAE